MKNQKLVYKTGKFILLKNLEFNKLKRPIYMQRMKIDIHEDDEKNKFPLNKSQIVEYEDEEYLQLKKTEGDPYIISDGENKEFIGKLQQITDQSDYFIFIKNNDNIEVYDVNKWYGFVIKSNNVTNEKDVEKTIKQLNKIQIESSNEEIENDIDYEENFDDDDINDKVIVIKKEKELTESGTKLQNLVDELDINDTPTIANKETELSKFGENKKAIKKTKKTLTEKDLVKSFGNKSITIKELLKTLSKMEFKLDEEEKEIIKIFLQKKCKFEENKITNEKLFKLI